MADYSDLAYGLAGYGKKNSRHDTRRKYGYGMLQSGMDTSPIQSPWQGAARLAQALVGGWSVSQADEAEKAAEEAQKSDLATKMAEAETEKDPVKKINLYSKIDPRLGMQGGIQLAVEQAKRGYQSEDLRQGANNIGAAYGMPPQGQGSVQSTPLGPPGGNANAIAGIESGGRYDAVGPVANAQGHRAYGKYQVLEPNIGPWTQEVLGRPMTPQEFLANPEAQNKVFEAKFGQYVTKYGSPQAASRAWFAGEGGMNNPNARDVNGMTVANYENKFNGALGGQPTQVAQGDGTPPAPSPQGMGGSTVIAPPAVPEAPQLPPASPEVVRRAQYLMQQPPSRGGITAADGIRMIEEDRMRQWQAQMKRQEKEHDIRAGDYRDAKKNQAELEKAAPMALIQQRTKNYEENIRPKAEAAVSEITSIHQARQMLDAGAITGTGAEARMAAQRLAQTLGVDWGTDQVANTVALQSAIGQRVLALVKNLGSGAGITNADREYAAKIAGGEISMTEQSMRRVMDIGERAARSTLRIHDGEVARVRKLNGMANIPSDYFDVPKAPTYDEWKAANPPPGSQPPGAPAPGVPGPTPPAEAMQPNTADPLEGKTATNPQTGQKIMRRGGQWVPAQ